MTVQRPLWTLLLIGMLACVSVDAATGAAPATAAPGTAPTVPSLTPEILCSRIDQRQGYGPFDYRKRDPENLANLKRVEDYHFRKDQRAAAVDVDRDTTFVWFNLDYTLRAFPNHHQALYLLAVYEADVQKRYPEAFRQLQTRPDFSPAQCYFKRALRFAPGDQNVYNTLGRAMHRIGRTDDAVAAFQKVVQLAPRSAEAHYNLGLAYYAAGKYEDSVASAKQAHALGYKRTELRARLQRKGYWK